MILSRGRRFLAALVVAAVAVALALAGASGRRVAAATALDPMGPEGMDLVHAFGLTRGSADTVVAYVEAGINWHLPEAAQLADHVYVNALETPVPCSALPCTLTWPTSRLQDDANGDGVVDAEDWAHDPRVHDANGNGFLDPEDLIAAFGRDGVDHDGDGYPNDISGYDLYDDQADPATVDATYAHSDDMMLNALSMCPDCMLMPVKAGAEALDATDTLAKAWLYAAQAGASVITSLTADLGESTFMRQAIAAIQKRGVVMVESSNDFDSTDHQGGMLWPAVVPGNGALADSSNTHWVRADETSWGTHNMFSVAGQGSTSASTSALGGLFGLVMSWGRHEYAAGRLAAPFTGDDAVQVLRATARPVTDTSLSWPGAPGDWSVQYGYGIPDLYAALQLVSAGGIAPAPSITSPEWYQLVDPATTASVPVTGTVSAAAGQRWTYQLLGGLGAQPASFVPLGGGSGVGSWSGTFGSVNTALIPKSFWDKAFTLSKTKAVETSEEYTVTLKVVVTDAAGRTGVDRRAFAAHHDATLVPGFPLRISSSGESQPALVDLQGTGRRDLVFGTSDGIVHALDPATGRELPGWPVTTAAVALRRSEPGVTPGHEPIIADVAVGALGTDGRPDVVATSAEGHVYVWDAAGKLLSGWPRAVRTGVVAPAIPRPAEQYSRDPVQGALAAPVLVDLDRDGRLDVVQAGWDGYLHAYRASGTELPGWPVRVALPASVAVPKGYHVVADQKLEATPAVAYLDGRNGPPSLVERSQYTMVSGAGIQLLGYSFTFAYGADGSLRAGWPVRLPSIIEYYGSAQEFVTEGTSSAAVADVNGDGNDEVAVTPDFSVPYLVNGAGHVIGLYGTLAPDLPASFTTSGAFGKLLGSLRFAQAQSGAISLALSELLDNSGNAIDEYESVYPAGGGIASLGFPQKRQGLSFLGEPAFADLDGTGFGNVLEGGDSSAVQAYSAIGTQVPGFPKFTSGWNVFSPSVGDLDGDGKVEVVTVTREGYVFAWRTAGLASRNTQWWRWQHDERNTGNYGTVIPGR